MGPTVVIKHILDCDCDGFSNVETLTYNFNNLFNSRVRTRVRPYDDGDKCGFTIDIFSDIYGEWSGAGTFLSKNKDWNNYKSWLEKHIEYIECDGATVYDNPNKVRKRNRK